MIFFIILQNYYNHDILSIDVSWITMIMDNLSICYYFLWYYYVLEPNDVITGNINVEQDDVIISLCSRCYGTNCGNNL